MSLIASDGTLSDGDWVESKDQDPVGGIRLLQLADVGDGVFVDRSNRFVNDKQFGRLRCTEVFEGDVLVARMPDPLGRACLAPKLGNRCITVVDVAIVRPGTSSVDPKWLMHFINAPVVRAQIELQSSGTTRRRISRGKIAQLELPVPPVAEQKRIAAKLDALLARVGACRKRLDSVPAILERFRQAVLSSAVRGDLTRCWRETHSVAQRARVPSSGPDLSALEADSTPAEEPLLEWLNHVPVGWKVERAAHVVEPGADIVYGIVQPGPKLADGVPYVRGMDIVNGRIQVEQLLRTSPEIARRYARASIKGGDVLLGIIRATKVAVVPDSLAGANITQGTARFRPSTKILTSYLAAVLEAPETQRWLHGHYRGIDMPGLNLADVRRVPIPLPSIPEQVEIASRVDSLMALADAIEARYETARAQVARLTPSLLAKAFRGELVSQDPNDEPAAELLKRLAQSRSEPPAKIRKPRRGKAA